MLDAAYELFLERGFEGTSVSDVVRRSGGSLATLYACFGSKEGLFEAIVGEISAQILAPLDALELESRPIDQALRLFGERFLSLVMAPEALRWHRMCVTEGPKFPELRAAFVRTGPGHARERLAEFLAAQVKAGRLRVDDPLTAALHFFALVKSETHLAAVCGEPLEVSPAEITEQVRRAVDVFLHGYAGDPGTAAGRAPRTGGRRQAPPLRKTSDPDSARRSRRRLPRST
jgi:AcrR family transcriptional regulator